MPSAAGVVVAENLTKVFQTRTGDHTRGGGFRAAIRALVSPERVVKRGRRGRKVHHDQDAVRHPHSDQRAGRG